MEKNCTVWYPSASTIYLICTALLSIVFKYFLKPLWSKYYQYETWYWQRTDEVNCLWPLSVAEQKLKQFLHPLAFSQGLQLLRIQAHKNERIQDLYEDLRLYYEFDQVSIHYRNHPMTWQTHTHTQTGWNKSFLIYCNQPLHKQKQIFCYLQLLCMYNTHRQ